MTDRTDPLGGAGPGGQDGHARQILTARLKTAWVERLRCEHDWLLKERLSRVNPACRGLRRLEVRPVSFDLFDGPSPRWGEWRRDARLIALNSDLIMNRPWEVVQGIMTHETAHQLVDDLGLDRRGAETAHGDAFHRACDILDLHPAYRRAAIDLAESGYPPPLFSDEALEPPQDPILDKVKKLLALSSSPEPHEAEAALAMASRLMAKHNVERRDLAQDGTGGPGFLRWRYRLGRSKLNPADYLIGRILRRHFLVRVVNTWEFDQRTLKTLRCVELLGRPVNLHLARHVMLFLQERTETLWQANRPRLAALGEKGLAARNTFINQMLDSFSKKLDAAEAAPFQGEVMPSSAVILSRDAGLEDFVNRCYLRLTTAHNRSGSDSPNSAEAGREAGLALSIHPPVAGGGGGGGQPRHLGWNG